MAVASDLQIGRAHVQHVIFLVLPDSALFIGPLKYQIRGLLGLPVLRALRRVGLAANGDLRIEPGRTATGTPNLFFDGKSAIVEVRHGNRRAQMFLDTGANASALYPSFRTTLTKGEIAALTVKDEQAGGVGEVLVRRTESVANVRLFIFGRGMDLSDISLLTTVPEIMPATETACWALRAARWLYARFSRDATPPRLGRRRLRTRRQLARVSN